MLQQILISAMQFVVIASLYTIQGASSCERAINQDTVLLSTLDTKCHMYKIHHRFSNIARYIIQFVFQYIRIK